MGRTTKKELEAALAHVERRADTYQELASALMRGERFERIAAGQVCVWVIAIERAHGGLCAITHIDEDEAPRTGWGFADDALGPSTDHYLRWAYSELQKEITARFARRSQRTAIPPASPC